MAYITIDGYLKIKVAKKLKVSAVLRRSAETKFVNKRLPTW